MTDYSNASSTGMFDPFIVSVQLCLQSVHLNERGVHFSEMSILDRCPPETGVHHRKDPP